MNFKKIMLLTIFSAALGQKTFCATTEPSQEVEAKTTVEEEKKERSVKKALEIFGGVATFVAAIAAFVYRENIQSFFTNSNDKPVNGKPVFDFITGHGITKDEDGTFYIKYFMNPKELITLEKEDDSNYVFFKYNKIKQFINKTQQSYSRTPYDDCLTWQELEAAHKQIVSKKLGLREKHFITFDNGTFYIKNCHDGVSQYELKTDKDGYLH